MSPKMSVNNLNTQNQGSGYIKLWYIHYMEYGQMHNVK